LAPGYITGSSKINKQVTKAAGSSHLNWIPALTVFLAGTLMACNPKAIPTVIFPAKKEVSTSSPAPQSAVINIFAQDEVNPDSNGTASPIQVRVFLASDEAAFTGVSFEELFEFGDRSYKDKPVIIETISPGTIASADFELSPEHKIIAVAAAFQDIGSAKWLEQISVEDVKLPTVNIVVTDNAVNHGK